MLYDLMLLISQIAVSHEKSFCFIQRCIALTVCAHRQNNTYADDHLLLVINVLFKNLDTHIRKCRENSVDFSPSLHDENDGGLQNATADAKYQCCQLKDMDMDYTSDGL